MTGSENAKPELRDILLKRSVCWGEFTLASGATSDLYVDARLTTHDPRGARLIGKVGWDIVKEKASGSSSKVDAIGGMTLGADPIALSIAMQSDIDGDPIQCFVVRKAAKEHGRKKRIEGNFEAGQSVVVVDDVVTTGGSTLQAIEAIEEAGGKVAFVLILVDRQEGGRRRIEEKGYDVESIFTREDLTSPNAGSEKASAASRAS